MIGGIIRRSCPSLSCNIRNPVELWVFHSPEPRTRKGELGCAQITTIRLVLVLIVCGNLKIQPDNTRIGGLEGEGVYDAVARGVFYLGETSSGDFLEH